MTALAYPQDLKPLTSLRFIAAFWVLLYHFKDHLGLGLGQFGLVADGYLGVDLFFTLSGFILAHVYLIQFEGGRFGYGGFLKNRIARVYPMHLAALGAMIVLFVGAGVGGNAGTQTMAVAVRAIATNQLTQSNTVRTILREIRVAFLNGATVAVVIGLGVAFVFANPQLGMVIAAAMMTNIVFAGFAGVMVPVILDRLDVDPAVSSSVFVTMITDSMGFFAFLGLAVASKLV